jgi:hypothetical protein
MKNTNCNSLKKGDHCRIDPNTKLKSSRGRFLGNLKKEIFLITGVHCQDGAAKDYVSIRKKIPKEEVGYLEYIKNLNYKGLDLKYYTLIFPLNLEVLILAPNYSDNNNTFCLINGPYV